MSNNIVKQGKQSVDWSPLIEAPAEGRVVRRQDPTAASSGPVTRADLVRFLTPGSGSRPHEVMGFQPETPVTRQNLPEVPESHRRAGEMADWLLRSYPDDLRLFRRENEIAKPSGDLDEILRYRGSILDHSDIYLLIDKSDPNKFWFKEVEFWTGETKYYGDGQKPYDAAILPWEERS